MLDIQKLKQRMQYIASAYAEYGKLYQKGAACNKGEKRKLTDLEFELLQVMEPEERSSLVVNGHLVAAFFGVTIRQVQNWAKDKRCPKLKHGMYDLKAVFTWWLEEIGGGADSSATEDVKLEYWREKMLRERIKRKQDEENLIARDEIVSQWTARLAEVSSGLEALALRLPPLLEGRNFKDMRRIVSDEVWKLKDNYCRTGKFCLPMEEGDHADEPSL